MSEAVVVDLTGDLDWTEFEIIGGTIPARVVTLHVERPSRARTLLVEFPDGFRRDADGWYECAEELVVLDGGLEMTGQTYGPNDWAWIPAGAPRRATRALPSMLALARFDGPARWQQGDPRAFGQPLRDVLGDRSRVLCRGDAQESSFVMKAPSGTATADTELLCLETRTWARVPAGATFPALDQACFCRRFDAEE